MAMVNEAANEQSTADEVKEMLYKTFNDALGNAKKELAEVRVKLEQYDEKYQASSTLKDNTTKVSEYFHSTFEDISLSLDDLGEKARHALLEAKEFSMNIIQKLWDALRENIDKLRDLAVQFDEKYKARERVVDLTTPLLEQLKMFGNSLDQASNAIKGATQSGKSFLIGTAASLEHKYHIEDKLTDLDQKYKILERAKTLQEKGEEFLEKQHILERVKQLDEKFTGSKAGEMLGQGVKIVNEEIEKVHKEYESAKEREA